jgi:hypothetical protein
MSNHYFLGRDSWLADEQRRERRTRVFHFILVGLAVVAAAGVLSIVGVGP